MLVFRRCYIFLYSFPVFLDVTPLDVWMLFPAAIWIISVEVFPALQAKVPGSDLCARNGGKDVSPYINQHSGKLPH